MRLFEGVDPFDGLTEQSDHLIEVLAGPAIWGPFTKYSLFLVIIFFLVLLVVFTAKKQLALVPKNRYVGFVEFFVDFTQNQIGYNVLGPTARKHLPFLLTLFLYILIANVVGVLPGSTAAMGTMGTTLALTVISFIYFTYYGLKQHGLWGYIKAYKPHGVKPAFIGIAVWVIELFSMVLRLFTLSVRLFANMFAGHILLGVLAILTTLFFMPMLTAFTLETFAFGAGSLAWLLFLTIMYGIKIFISILQAFIFTLLSSVYLMLATTDH
ncbi:MAG: F0F1 ATP synthase subunit A [Coriobacteriia bacterium]|nr:F0F1 ATP synthase subunit A [Coriobacteriia bacterium]MCL2750060.1 F0F1 ATP synthase subunit A [Coriobacteriia bacterium]